MQGRVLVDREAGELKLLVKINSQHQSAEEKKKAKAVKDLKQLSGVCVWVCAGKGGRGSCRTAVTHEGGRASTQWCEATSDLIEAAAGRS